VNGAFFKDLLRPFYSSTLFQVGPRFRPLLAPFKELFPLPLLSFWFGLISSIRGRRKESCFPLLLPESGSFGGPYSQFLPRAQDVNPPNGKLIILKRGQIRCFPSFFVWSSPSAFSISARNPKLFALPTACFLRVFRHIAHFFSLSLNLSPTMIFLASFLTMYFSVSASLTVSRTFFLFLIPVPAR